ncbi:hypothetical protein KIPB_009506, partial [Kipferlia bialata]
VREYMVAQSRKRDEQEKMMTGVLEQQNETHKAEMASLKGELDGAKMLLEEVQREDAQSASAQQEAVADLIKEARQMQIISEERENEWQDERLRIEAERESEKEELTREREEIAREREEIAREREEHAREREAYAEKEAQWEKERETLLKEVNTLEAGLLELVAQREEDVRLEGEREAERERERAEFIKAQELEREEREERDRLEREEREKEQAEESAMSEEDDLADSVAAQLEEKIAVQMQLEAQVAALEEANATLRTSLAEVQDEMEREREERDTEREREREAAVEDRERERATTKASVYSPVMAPRHSTPREPLVLRTAQLVSSMRSQRERGDDDLSLSSSFAVSLSL